MTRRILLSLVMLAAAPLAAQADPFNYTYVEGGYTSVNPQHGGSTLSGLGVDGDYAFDPDWHALAAYSHVSCCGFHEDDLSGGVGWNTRLTPILGLYVEGEILNVSRSGGGGSDTGWQADGGLRAQLADRFELDGFVDHTSVDGNSENTLGVRALFDMDTHWHLFASYANNSDADTIMAGVRYTF
jgi:hypothetical protein